MVAFNRTDLEFVLAQIQMAEAGQPPVNPHLPFGLREVAGTDNNAVPGQETFGSADQTFPQVAPQVFQTVTVNVDGTIFDPNPGAEGNTITTSYQQTAVNNAVDPFGNPVAAGVVVDPTPRVISNLIADQTAANPAALEAQAAALAALGTGYQNQYSPATPPAADGDGNLFIPNVTPDAGLSAPFNTWFTLFGQFFDHGLDLISKGGSGTVFIPLQPDDPLYVPGGNSNFMVLTRATNAPGADGILGTADDIHVNTNTTTPFVDQNQTYSSHPSHQVFLRDYALGLDGQLRSTGRLLEGHRADGSVDGMATWADVKANALKLGLALTDADVGNVPLLATDDYGNFIPGAHGFAQVVVKHTNGSTTLVEGTAEGLDLRHPDAGDPDATVVRTGHAFIDDTAHFAVPVFNAAGDLAPDADLVAGDLPGPGTYDNELLDAHYVAGDGRANENIGLTAVHQIFHDEHNRLIDQIKALIESELANGDSSFASNWVLAGADLSNGIQDNEWNGERLFQAAKFGTETQYQHLVFEEFARKVAPTIHLFGNIDIHLDPAITAEFANAVYRFGHSMLDENVNRYQIGADGTPVLDANGRPVLNAIGLIDAFTNPLAFAAAGADAAGEIALGTTNQVGNEIDEFVTGALRNNLLGLPLDLPALNIARGRDTGVPPINLLRNQLFAQTQDSTLKPYDSWSEFGQFLKHPASLINFVGAYGTHMSIVGATTLEQKRAAALDLVTTGLDPGQVGTDAYNFMHSLGAYANDVDSAIAVHGQWSTGSITGVDNVDLWIGGLAEKQSLFGGLLGSTFNFIFETQLEALQDGDRLYYLPRLEGTHFGTEVEANSFAEMIANNTGVKHLSASIFLTPEYVVEAGAVTSDPATWLKNPETGANLVEKLADGTVHFIGDDNFLGNTIVLGGTEGDDRLVAGHADDDTVWGDGGNDFIDGGNGNDFLYGGTGDDLISDSGGDDVIHGDAGNDTIFAGIGADIVFGGVGNDVIDAGAGIDSVLGGLGDDVIRGGEDDDALSGNEGDDWIEGGDGGDLIVGDQGAPTGQVPLISGNDVLDGGRNGDRMQGFSGDDIMLGLGGFDRFEGGLGFDWADFEQETHGVSVDMARREFVGAPSAPAGDAIRDAFIETEGVSGTAFNDVLQGNNAAVLDPQLNELTNVNLIFGLDEFFPTGPVAYSGGDIMLGGDGSDVIEGRGGNDIIDGDAWLHVELDPDGNGGFQALREILYDVTPGDIDTVVFSDISSNYNIDLTPDEQGFFTVTHLAVGGGGGGGAGGGGVTPGIGIDGADKLRNIERLQFADLTMSVDAFAPGANQVPFGTVVIQGDTNTATAIVDPLVGSVLTADPSNLFDFDFDFGVITTPIHYQWQYQVVAPGGGGNEWVAIAGATGETFTPGAFFQSFPLRVQASYVDGKGFTEVVNSAATSAVASAVGVNTAPIVVHQRATVGIPDTQAQQGSTVSYFIPLTTLFSDQQTPSNQLIYTAKMINGQLLDGSAAAYGLSFNVNFDAAGAVLNGVVSGDLLPTFSGHIDIRVTVTDRGPGTPLAVTDNFVINVLHANQPPVASPDVYSTAEDTTLAVGLVADGVLGNDTDPEGLPIAAALVQGPLYGSLVLNANGTFTYTPNADFTGADTFSYKATDSRHASAATSVTINVAPVDDGVAPLTISGFAAEGQALTANLGFDPDGDGTPPVFQWLRDGTTIAGATEASLTLTADDVGHSLTVTASYTDGQGFADMAASAATDTVGLTITGSAAANTLIGTANNDFILGLAGNDSLNGLAGNDWLDGGAGNDTLNGGTGNDIMLGGVGNDTLVVDSVGDVVVENLDEGTDTVQTTLSVYALTPDVENLSFIGAGDFVGTGNDLVNRITGGAGNDLLDGGLGNDRLIGGAGNDTYMADAGDVITEAGGGGIDTVLTDSASFALAANVENLAFVGVGGFTGTGNTLSNVISGAAEDDILTGGGGNDVLNGDAGHDIFRYLFGNGADTIDGGIGNDTLEITGTAAANTLDVIFDGVSLTQFEGGTLVNVEQVAADLLGGTDTLSYAGTTTSVTVDLVGGAASGFSSITGIENVVGGSGDDTLTGDEFVNTLNGGLGNDTLDGGLGNDTMVGGGGNDTYIANAGDLITEAAGGGTDNVQTSSASFTLGANVENLTFTGSGDFSGAGNTLANTLTGGADNDILTGGTNNDVLNGGLGNDTFIYAFGDGADAVDGGFGSDTLAITGTAAANVLDVIFNGSALTLFEGGTLTSVEQVNANLLGGTDTLSYAGSTAAVTVNLATSNASGLASIAGIENVVGGTGNDTLTGDAGINNLNGGAGDDTLDGGAGNDALVGGVGNDIYIANNGDTLSEAIGGGTDTVWTGSGSFTLAANIENLTYTGAGNFVGSGNAGANIITGGAGADVLNGGGGDDRIIGGAGNDVMNGGTGNDTFVFAPGFGTDVVNGFDANPAGGQDIIDISGLSVTGASFAADVQIAGSAAVTLITIGANSIVLSGVNAATINQSDFLLA